MRYMDMLDRYIKEYKTVPFSPRMRFHNAEGDQIKSKFTFPSASSYLDEYLNFYRECKSLEEAIKYSCLGLFEFNYGNKCYEVRHPHQQCYTNKYKQEIGVPTFVLSEMSSILLENINVISNATNFEDLIDTVTDAKISKFGALAIYDTSVRIGAFLGKDPKHVYMHAGARKGIENLELKNIVPNSLSFEEKIEVESLPYDFQALHPIQIENFLCLYKDKFLLLDGI